MSDTLDLIQVRTNDEIAPLIRDRKQFRTRVRKTAYGTFISMSGYSDEFRKDADSDAAISVRGCLGNLPWQYGESLARADYVVLSYETPIAWHLDLPADLTDVDSLDAWVDGRDNPGVWVIPDVKYSITTTDHQQTVRMALSGYGRWSWHLPDNLPSLPARELSIAGAATRVPCSVERVGW